MANNDGVLFAEAVRDKVDRKRDCRQLPVWKEGTVNGCCRVEE